MKLVTVLAALSGALGVAAGAFGAHGAEGQAAEWLRTGGQYQLIHAVVALIAARTDARGPAWCFVAGGAVFAGTLYLMALGAPRVLGAVTPLGGLMLIVGWVWLAWSAALTRPGEKNFERAVESADARSSEEQRPAGSQHKETRYDQDDLRQPARPRPDGLDCIL